MGRVVDAAGTPPPPNAGRLAANGSRPSEDAGGSTKGLYCPSMLAGIAQAAGVGAREGRRHGRRLCATRSHTHSATRLASASSSPQEGRCAAAVYGGFSALTLADVGLRVPGRGLLHHGQRQHAVELRSNVPGLARGLRGAGVVHHGVHQLGSRPHKDRKTSYRYHSSPQVQKRRTGALHGLRRDRRVPRREQGGGGCGRVQVEPIQSGREGRVELRLVRRGELRRRAAAGVTAGAAAGGRAALRREELPR